MRPGQLHLALPTQQSVHTHTTTTTMELPMEVPFLSTSDFHTRPPCQAIYRTNIQESLASRTRQIDTYHNSVMSYLIPSYNIQCNIICFTHMYHLSWYSHQRSITSTCASLLQPALAGQFPPVLVQLSFHDEADRLLSNQYCNMSILHLSNKSPSRCKDLIFLNCFTGTPNFTPNTNQSSISFNTFNNSWSIGGETTANIINSPARKQRVRNYQAKNLTFWHAWWWLASTQLGIYPQVI